MKSSPCPHRLHRLLLLVLLLPAGVAEAQEATGQNNQWFCCQWTVGQNTTCAPSTDRNQCINARKGAAHEGYFCHAFTGRCTKEAGPPGDAGDIQAPIIRPQDASAADDATDAARPAAGVPARGRTVNCGGAVSQLHEALNERARSYVAKHRLSCDTEQLQYPKTQAMLDRETAAAPPKPG